MHISLPDPHPGRCANMRTHMAGDGSIETLRCLHYEGHDSRCDFPNPKPVIPNTGSYNFHQFNPPKPWKDPTVND